MKKIIILLLSSIPFFGNAQDIHFSQYLESPLNINPGLAGTDFSFARANLNYRNQWSSFGKPFQTMAASIDMPFFKKGDGAFLGAGISFYNDKSGTTGLTKNDIAGTLSGVLVTAKNTYLSLGIQGSYNQRSINLSNVRWDAQYNGISHDPSLPSGEAAGSMKKNFIDLGAGIAFLKHGNSSNLSGSDDFTMSMGFSIFHINKANQAFQGSDKLNMRYNGFAKFSFGISGTNLAIQPQFGYWQQGGLREINMGMMFKYVLKPESQFTGFERGMALSVGAFYRLKDALCPMLMFEYADYSIGVSYDINLSSLTPYSQGKGGFEISLRYRDLNGLLFGQGGKHVKFL